MGSQQLFVAPDALLISHKLRSSVAFQRDRLTKSNTNCVKQSKKITLILMQTCTSAKISYNHINRVAILPNNKRRKISAKLRQLGPNKQCKHSNKGWATSLTKHKYVIKPHKTFK